jgi:hypothetical protein
MKAQGFSNHYPQSSQYPLVNTNSAGSWCLHTEEYDAVFGQENIPCFTNSQAGTSNLCNSGNQQNTSTYCKCGFELSTTAGIAANNLPKQVWLPTLHTPHSSPAAIRADLMTIEQTAIWIRTLSLLNGWEEANQYSSSFRENDIWGHLLPKLTADSLKSELSIMKYGHRLEILLAIKCMYYGVCDEVATNAESSDQSKSPMSESDQSSVNDSPMQTFKSFSGSPAHKSNQHEVLSSTFDGSSHNSTVLPSCNGSVYLDEHAKEVLKWTGKPLYAEAKIKNRYTAVDHEVTSAKVLFF